MATSITAQQPQISNSRKALILIADGTEEMEFTITYDTLIRAGITTTSAFVSDPRNIVPLVSRNSAAPAFATCSRGLKIIPDLYFDSSDLGPENFDVLIIPGGAKGAETISQTPRVQELVREYLTGGKLVGMICAGSLTALTANLPRQPLTSHPSVRDQLKDRFEYDEESVVVSGNLITSRGPGTTFPFAFKLVELLCGGAKKAEVIGPMVFPFGTAF